jgi:hypothetical protein
MPLITAFFTCVDADPEFYFTKKLKEQMTGYTNRPLTLSCHINQPGGKIKWLKDGKAISVSVRYINKIKHNWKVCCKPLLQYALPYLSGK